MIDRRQFLKWTGYMIAAAAVTPSALVREKVEPLPPHEPGDRYFVNYREQARQNLAEWHSEAWSKAMYEATTRKTYFHYFAGGPGKYNGVILRQK